MKYIFKKLCTLIITLFIVSLLAFYAFALIGDPTTSMLGTNATPEQVAALQQELGLDRPVLVRYGEWLLLFLQGDMGTSYSYHMSVASMVGPKLPITAVLTLMAFVLTVVVSIPLGIATARREGGWFDKCMTVIDQIVMSVPPFFIGILLTVVLLSAVVAILSVAIPLNRKRDAVTSLGEQSLLEASSLAMSMEYYNGLRIQSLLDYPSETVFYQNLCGFLSRAKQTLSYDRAYILYQGLEGRIAYLADADYAKDLQAGVDYHAIGEEYTDERYTRRCISILQEQFEGRRKEAYVPDILDDSYIITYLPLRNADGEVMAVLGVDAKLGYSDFAQYGPINFERLTSISALLFLLSLVLFVLCMDKGLSEEEKENRWRRRHGLPPKPTKKDNIVVDTLDDIDPNDYL